MEIVTKIDKANNYFDTLSKNPLTWNNNKRRFYGYPPLRKYAKRKFWELEKLTIFKILSVAIEETLEQQLSILIDYMPNIDEVKFNEKSEKN